MQAQSWQQSLLHFTPRETTCFKEGKEFEVEIAELEHKFKIMAFLDQVISHGDTNTYALDIHTFGASREMMEATATCA